MNGGTLITVEGSGFSTLIKYFCYFGNNAIQSTVVTSNLLTCLAPKIDSKSTVLLKFSAGNESFFESFVFNFKYFNINDLIQVLPFQGGKSGSQSIKFIFTSYLSFSDMAYFNCVFGNITVEAENIGDNTIECLSPPSSVPGPVDIGLELNGVITMSPALKFTYLAEFELSSLEPSHSSTDGGTTVKLLGKGFNFDSELSCRFGLVYTTAEFISENEVKCVSPSHIEGSVEVALIVGEVESSKKFDFKYVTSAKVTSVFPLVGDMNGGTLITVEGSGFLKSLDLLAPSMNCMFGNKSVIATIISDTRLTCLSPLVINQEIVSFFINIVSETKFDFKYLYFHLYKILPNYGSYQNSSVFSVYGSIIISIKRKFSCFIGDYLSFFIDLYDGKSLD
jgi:hypothetical protein